jgi:acetyl esterase/lipase
VTVSWWYFALSVWGALFTIVALRPPKRPIALVGLTFFAAWLATELAIVHLAWQLTATIVFVRLGALDDWPGWAGLAITFASWCGMFGMIVAAYRTRAVFNEALDDALGPQWRDRVEPGDATEVHVGIEWARVFLPFRFKRKGVERTRDLQYVDDGRRRHRLDVYRSRETPAGAPVLLQIHGGGWMIGNKEQQGLPIMYHLASRGWVCVAINYRLSPKATWPDHLVDCKRAMQWIREHIAEFGGDPNYVVVTGGSAGGHLTAMMGLTANDPAFQPGFEDVDTTIQAMVPFYGVYDWTAAVTSRDRGLRDALQRFIVKRKFADAPEVYEQASPIKRIHADAPPACIVHGTLDTLAPVSEARAFAAKLREVSHNPVVYVELRGAQHAFEIYNSIRSMQAIAGVRSFLRYLLNSSRPAAISLGAASPTYDAPVESGASDQRSTVRTEP